MHDHLVRSLAEERHAALRAEARGRLVAEAARAGAAAPPRERRARRWFVGVLVAGR